MVESTSTVNLDQLEKQLAGDQFLGGQQPSAVDRDTYEQLKSTTISPETHPNVFGWFSLVRRFTDVVRGAWGGAAAGAKQEKKAAPAKKEEVAKTAVAADDDDVDLFGDEEETEEEKAKLAEQKEKVAAYKKGKEGKPALIAKSLILFDVKPWETETDLDALFLKIKAIEIDGLIWKEEYKKEPIAYGINKLVVGCVIEDAKVSTDDLQERIEAIEEDVQSVDIAIFSKI